MLEYDIYLLCETLNVRSRITLTFLLIISNKIFGFQLMRVSLLKDSQFYKGKYSIASESLKSQTRQKKFIIIIMIRLLLRKQTITPPSFHIKNVLMSHYKIIYLQPL